MKKQISLPTNSITSMSVENTRFVFAQAGVPYEDIRLTGEQWAEFKPKTPYGAMPVLEVDGKVLAGSGPIERSVAEHWQVRTPSKMPT